MKEHAAVLARRFRLVLDMLEKEVAPSGAAAWESPDGGYFIAVDTLPGCAGETVRLAAEAGVKLTGAGATWPLKQDPRDTNIRLAPTYPALKELEQAISVFCVCVKLAAVRKLLG